MSQMTVYDAINAMRELSKRTSRSASPSCPGRRPSRPDGIKEVRRGQLKNRTKEADFLNAEMIEEYIDLDTMEYSRF